MSREWRPPAEAVLAMVRDVAAGGTSVPGDALAPRGPASPTYTIDEIRRAFGKACLSESVPFFRDWPAIADGVCDALATDTKGGE